jgi:RpiR family transcriptional regulator, carbohydrate utilization regulator
MASIRVKIKSLYNSLSPAHKQLADYIVLEEDNDVSFLSVHELAEAVGISVASISRFARTVGCPSYKALKTQLRKEVTPSVRSIYQAIGPEDTDDEIIDKVFAGNVQSIEETLKILNRRDLIRAAKMLAESPRVVFFGIGSSGNIAEDAALRFSHLGIQADAYLDSYQILNRAPQMKKGEVVVGISTSGRSAITVEALQLASRNGSRTIGISNCLKSPLHKASDIFFCTSFPESRITAAALSPLAAQVCLVDAIYLLVARQKKDALSCAEQADANTERMFRLPPK